MSNLRYFSNFYNSLNDKVNTKYNQSLSLYLNSDGDIETYKDGNSSYTTVIPHRSQVERLIADSLDGKFDKTGGNISGGITAPNVTLTDTSPLFFNGNGSGTYDKSCLYVNSDGIRFETPRATDSASGTILPFSVCTRGGQYAPLYAGNIYSNDSQVITHRSYAHYATDGGANWYKINIDSQGSWMVNLTVRLYQSYTATDLQISGYNYGSSYWYQPQVRVICKTGMAPVEVKFGYDAAWQLWFAVPGGSYTGLDILDVVWGFQNVSSSFTITAIDSLTGTVQTTKTAYPPVRVDNFSYSNGTLTITTT